MGKSAERESTCPSCHLACSPSQEPGKKRGGREDKKSIKFSCRSLFRPSLLCWPPIKLSGPGSSSLSCAGDNRRGRGRRGSSASLAVKAEVEAHYYFMSAEEGSSHSEAWVARR